LKSEFGKPRIVLDTKPLIRLFAKEDGWEAVRTILSSVEDEETEAAISVVTLTEIYYKYLQEGREDLARDRIRQIRHAVNINTLMIDEEIAIQAGRFKGKYGVPVADAFIAASAYSEDSIVVSDDAHFKRIADIRTMSEEEFLSHLG